jgi:hypothetical protein
MEKKLVALHVLDDCRYALAALEAGKMGADFRLYLAAIFTLLRSVGHVLDKVDGKNPVLKPIIKEKWQNLKDSKPNPKIFWKFIEAERNSILKEYEIHFGQNITIFPESIAGSSGVSPKQRVDLYTHLIDYKINDGEFEGDELLELLRKSILWWEEYLAPIANRPVD